MVRSIVRFAPALIAVAGLSLLTMGLAAASDEKKEAPTSQPAVGSKAEDFTLKTINDKSVTLSELNKTGPVVVIELRGWVGYQCPLCTKQIADLRAHAKEFAAANAKIVLVYPGPAENLKDHASDFIGGKGLPEGFYFVLDPDLKFVNAWGLRWDAPKETAYPATFVIDSEGIIRFKKVSKSHGDRASATEVLKALGVHENK